MPAHALTLLQMRIGGVETFFPVGARNMLLRGCTLRNTKWMLGLVVYTGKETKVMKKSGGARSKMSQVEKTMNMCIKLVFAAQVVLCSVTTIAESVWSDSRGDQSPYLMSGSLDLWIPKWLGNWFTFLLLFNNFIPISLYVTVEMVNYLQAAMIGTDIGMYDPETDTAARARTSNLNQDLGQIEYVFSDKTGTLTRNVMEFKQCSIGGKSFGKFVPEAMVDEEERMLKAAGASRPEAGDEEDPAPAAPKTPVNGGDGVIVSGSNPMYKGKKKAPAADKALDDSTVVAATPSTPAAVAKANGFDDPALVHLLLHAKVPAGYGAEWTPIDGQVKPNPAADGVNYGPFERADVVALEAFFTCMSVCHTVVPEDEEGRDLPVYQAESPDEAALTYAARHVGFSFAVRQADHIVVTRTNGSGSTQVQFMTYGVHEFNSTRKRMSVVVRAPDGRYLLMCKGADNVMFDRSTAESTRLTLENHLTMFASTGLRTLVLCQRELSPAEFASWQAEYHEASVSLVGREDKLAAVAEKYESNMSVLGATAIEDRLQEGVPGTIRDLRRAGIKTWVLTGDKVETAINIGYSCRLLDPAMDLITITSEDTQVLRQQLQQLEAQFKPFATDPVSFLDRLLRRKSGTSLSRQPSSTGLAVKVSGTDGGVDFAKAAAAAAADPAASTGTRGVTNMAIVVTGQALTHILGEADMESAFLTVAKCCKSVIACRVSPQQKANIVKMVRQSVRPKPLTLAIGDGANDVGMIQRAEVGVGISGREGLQAANAADFSISQFRFLKRLLLVHGRWDYRRMTKVVLYSFYKNVVITLSLFYFNALTGFSGTSFYESLVYSSYNFVLGLPIVFIGILDRDISAKTALDHPSVYASGLYYMDLNLKKMLSWIAKAVAHSAIVFWIPYGVYSTYDASWDGTNGRVDGMAVAGLTTFCCLVWGMTLQVSIQTLTWTWLNHFFVWLSLGVWYIFIIAYASNTFSPDITGVTLTALSRPSYYLVIILCLGAMLLFDLVLDLVRTQFFPDPVDIAREIDAGLGTPGRNGLVHWGDEDTEDDKMRAAAELAAIGGTTPKPGALQGGSSGSGATGTGFTSTSAESSDSKNGGRAAGNPTSQQQGEALIGSIQQATTNSRNDITNDQQPAATTIAAGNSTTNGLQPVPPAIAKAGAFTGGGAQPPAVPTPGRAWPTAATESASPDGTKLPPAPPAAVARGTASARSDYTATDGTVYVSQSAVLAGADQASKAAMGIVKPDAFGKGFAYNYVSRRNNEVSQAPEDKPASSSDTVTSP